MTKRGWLLALGWMSTMLQAQEAAKDGPPVPLPSTVRGSAVPAMSPDRRITFRLKAPEAKLVEVRRRS